MNAARGNEQKNCFQNPVDNCFRLYYFQFGNLSLLKDLYIFSRSQPPVSRSQPPVGNAFLDALRRTTQIISAEVLSFCHFYLTNVYNISNGNARRKHKRNA